LQKESESVFDALAQPVRASLLDLGFRRPTQPQRLAIPHILRGKNVLLVAAESIKKDNLSRMKASLLAQKAQLLCLQCGSTLVGARVEELPEFPKCQTCGSGLLSLASKVRPDAAQILQKWRSREELTDEEPAVLSRAR
jgi:hypothetical protein